MNVAAPRVHSLVAICLLAAGCASLRAPVVDPELDIAPEPAATPAPESVGKPAADWWTSFGDPALDQVVERALSGNLTLQEAAARLAQAAADAGIARSALFPQVGTGVERIAARQAFIGLPIPGIGEDEVLTADYVRYGLSLDLSWEANLWRAATPRARAANAVVEAAVAEVAGARISLAGQAARLYFLAIEAREQARIAEAIAASLQETVRWTRERARIGEAALAQVDAAAGSTGGGASDRREPAAGARGGGEGPGGSPYRLSGRGAGSGLGARGRSAGNGRPRFRRGPRRI